MSDLNYCTTKIQDNPIPTEIARYNEVGKASDKLNDTTCVALTLKTDKLIYRVKVDKNNKFYNPKDVDRFYGLNQRDRVTNTLQFKFREVNKSCFDLYIKYLQTKQDSILLLAEREKNASRK